MGRQLARFLEDRIDEIANDRMSDDLTMTEARSQIIREMGNAADIEPGTVRQILNAEINCPPRERIVSFADALNVSQSQIFSAAESDGCNYEESEDKSTRIRVVKRGAQNLLQIIQAAPVANAPALLRPSD